MDRIRRLELFVRAVDTGSFAKAAASFEITPSGVSRAIAELEKQLGVALFHRTTRHLKVTDEGSDLYQRAREILEKLDEAEGALARVPGSPKGTLRVGLNVPISRHVIMPALGSFVRKYPGLRLIFEILNSPQEMYAEGVDLLLRIGDPPDSDLVARKLALIQYGLYASPTYIAAAGTASQPEDLIDHVCLVHKPPWQAKPFDEWEFERDGEKRSLKVLPSAISDDREGLLVSAASGAGVVRMGFFDPSMVIQGHLQRLLPDWRCPGGKAIYAMYRRTPALSPKVEVFLNFVSEAFAAFDQDEITLVHVPSHGSRPSKTA
jgi:LysR family transcriptional regulator, transcriptional activator for dmlA